MTRPKFASYHLKFNDDNIGATLAECPKCFSLVMPNRIEGHWNVCNNTIGSGELHND